MVVKADMRWPQPRSPDELRAFYSIALHSDQDETRVSTESNESRSIAPTTWSSSGSGRYRASCSTSLFSGQARTGSSATSVSDSRTVVALAPKTTSEDTTGLLRLHEWQCPGASQVECHAGTAKFVGEGFKVDVSYQTHDERPIRHKWRGKSTLPRLSHYQGRGDRNEEEGSDPVISRPAEPEPEEKFWLDTLQEHPYCNLESERKLGRVGMWAVKRRRRDLKTSHSKTKETTDAESEIDLPRNNLLEDSISTLDSDDETVHIIDDVVEEAVSLMGSSKSRLKLSRSDNSRLGSAERTLLLDLGEGDVSRSSLDFDDPEDSTLASVASLTTTGTFELSLCEDLDDIGEGSHITYTERTIGKHLCEDTMVYYCLFCFQDFESRFEWEDHEQSQHLDKQRDWICMPWGATERQEDGHEVCVFCGLLDPSPSHGSEHNDEPCCHTSVTRRTYSNKSDFEDHLQDVHNQHTISEAMEKWSFSVEDEDWYWQCGFCERSLVGWEDRSRHIGRHFREGLSLAAWDPAVPSGPIDRFTGIAVSWSTPIEMDRRKLLAAQGGSDEKCTQHYRGELSVPNRLDSIHNDELRSPFRCQYCNAMFVDEVNVGRHEKLWHLPRDVWRCPTKNDIRTATHLQDGPLGAFLFPNATTSAMSRADVCPYCFEHAEDIFYDLNEDIDECDADWEVRIEHLELEHGFNKCQKDLAFFRPDQFLLHLVGCHNMKLSKWTKEIMASCKRRTSVPSAGDDSRYLKGVGG